jgi:hypothetical protein
MKLIVNHLGHKFIDFKKSIETTDPLEKAILIRWWIKNFHKNWCKLNCGYYLIEKKVNNVSYCMMIDMGVFEKKMTFESYFHNQTKIKEEERDNHFFIEKDIINSSLDELYKLYKQSLIQWENHLKNSVSN